MNAEPTLNSDDTDELVRLLAQKSVDIIIDQSKLSGTDPLEALNGAILYAAETLHWAKEAKESILSKRSKNLERGTNR